MKQEPTLMMGDLPFGLNYSHMDILICNTIPRPTRVRDSLTRDKTKINRFYQYESFEDARCIWRTLNGTPIPSISPDFTLDLTFTMQDKEFCAFFSLARWNLNRSEIYQIMRPYPSVLGVAHHHYGRNNNGDMSTTCMVRFYEKEDCMQAVMDLHEMPFDNSVIFMTIAARNIRELQEYVWNREASKINAGLASYHNYYVKRQVGREEFNQMILNSESFFEDVEASRWSDVVYRKNTTENEYIRHIALSYYHFR